MSPRARFLIGLALGFTVAASAALTPAWAQDKPRYGGELVALVPSEPPTYDGHAEGTFGVVHPLAPHYNGLLRIDPFDRTGTRVVPDVAESWTVAKDGLTYTLKLRRGVKFHDGAEMTSRDVKASYDKIVSPPEGVRSYRKGAYRAVEAVEAPDPYTVRFRLKWPQASFLTLLASPYSWIYKADILEKDIRWYERNVLGTGPFKFVEHVKGSHWVSKKNPDYWDKGKPYLDGYRVLFISASSAQVAAIRAERAHIQFRGFSPAERDSLVAALGPKITVQESPWDCVLLVAMNHERKPFDDKRVRKALTLALDRWDASRNLSKIAVVKEVAGIQVPGTQWATPPAELEKLAGYGRDIRRRPRGGAAAAPRGGRARRLRLHLQEPRDPPALRAGGDLARGPVAADRAPGQAGGDRGLRLSPHARQGRLRRGDGLPVQLRGGARRRHRQVPVGEHLRQQLRPLQGPRARRSLRAAGPGHRRGRAEARTCAPSRSASSTRRCTTSTRSSGTASSRTARKCAAGPSLPRTS